jgi:opacity protein-like surface antigen
MWKICLVALVATILAGSQAQAQGAYFGPQLGFFNVRDADNAKAMGGAALRLGLSPALGIEASINYRSENYAGGRVAVRSWPVMVTGLVYPIPIVYGAIGAGWYNTTFDYNRAIIGQDIASETTQQFGWHFGGGLELPVGTSAKFVADVRYVFLNYSFKQFPGSTGLNADFYVITVGLLFGI